MPHTLYGEILAVFGIAVAATLVLRAVLTFPFLYFKRVRCRRAFATWLLDHRMEVVDRAHRFFFRGPFYGKDGGFSVGELRLKDERGGIRTAFVRCGDHRRGWLGRHDIEVRWEGDAGTGRPGRLRSWLLGGMLALLVGAAVTVLWWAFRRA